MNHRNPSVSSLHLKFKKENQMYNILWLPGKYCQGKGLLAQAGSFIASYGRKPLILWESFLRDSYGERLLDSFRKQNITPCDSLFHGETTRNAAKQLAEKARSESCDVIIGVGGGKAIDTAKGAAAMAGIRCVVIPTVASNDAPTSACTVWYTEDGEYDGFDMWPHNPDMILVDTEIIAKAPARFFVAGMGDALATWPEASAAYSKRAISCTGGIQTLAAMSMAKLCFETIMEYGLEAKTAVENQVVTPAVEKVIEANIFLSGIGWESGGLATAHAIANSLPMIHETHGFLHGEKVAFGLVTQLCLEQDWKVGRIHKIVDFLIAIGLPVTLAEMKMQDVSRERFLAFAQAVSGEGSFVHNHPFRIAPADIVNAIFAADSLGRRRKECQGSL